MPEYLAPGVFVEETSFRAKSIEGVGTSVAAVVGPTRTGPVRGTPEVVTSYTEFERVYGDPGDLTLDQDGTAVTVLNHTALAARAFFENGGKQLFVARVIGGGNGSDEDGMGASATAASAVGGSGAVSFAARFPGAGGNLTLELTWADTQNLLKLEQAAAIGAGETLLLTLAGPLESSALKNHPGAGAHDPAKFPLQSLTALVVADGDDYGFAPDALVRVVNADGSGEDVAAATLGDGVLAAAVVGQAALTRVYAAPPAAGPLGSGGAPAELVLARRADISAFVQGGEHWGDRVVIRGTLDQGGTVFTVAAALNGLSTSYPLRLAALAAAPGAAKSLRVQRNFNLDVLRHGEPVYQVAGIALDPASEHSLEQRLPVAPSKRLDALTQPVSCTLSDSADEAAVYAALYDLFQTGTLTPEAGSFDEPRYLIPLTGGTDGALPTATDYAGETDEVKGSTGLAALEEVEDVSIVITPAAAADAANHQAVVAELQKHCAKMRYRVGIVDSREGMALSEVRAFRDNFDDSRLALYYPWVVASDPTAQRSTIALPPAGFVAGIYARTDVERGVHKAPANTAVLGALRFNQDINRFQQELLNPNGINCLRSFPGRGHRVWGARTLSSDPEWKYVNVRRYFLFLERSVEKGTQWAVFEPNGEALWANVRTTVEDFLFNEWRNGHLLGAAPKEAYFVRCDRSTMTQNDIDNGRLVCLVGVAPLRPAEFVIFRIGQKTADA